MEEGENFTLTYTQMPGKCNHTITAKADDEVEEISEENNVAELIVQVAAPPAFFHCQSERRL
jgi:hypothetical protein